MTEDPEDHNMSEDPEPPVVGTKRAITVDPDNMEPLQESKKPRIQLDASKKVKCLTAMLTGFREILVVFFPLKRK